MAKRKRATQYPKPDDAIPLVGLVVNNQEVLSTSAEIEKFKAVLKDKLKGLMPPAPNDMTEDEQIASLNKLMNPTPETLTLQHKGLPENDYGVEPETKVQLPPHPYPFNNPVTMTKELDNNVRELRGLAPGAGTAQSNVLTNVPPIGYIAKRVGDPKLQNDIMSNNYDPRATNLLGTSPIKERDPNLGNSVYINPRQPPWMTKMTIAHELSHRNKPSTDDDYNDPPWGVKSNPSAQYVGDLYDSILNKRYKK